MVNIPFRQQVANIVRGLYICVGWTLLLMSLGWDKDEPCHPVCRYQRCGERDETRMRQGWAMSSSLLLSEMCWEGWDEDETRMNSVARYLISHAKMIQGWDNKDETRMNAVVRPVTSTLSAMLRWDKDETRMNPVVQPVTATLSAMLRWDKDEPCGPACHCYRINHAKMIQGWDKDEPCGPACHRYLISHVKMRQGWDKDEPWGPACHCYLISYANLTSNKLINYWTVSLCLIECLIIHALISKVVIEPASAAHRPSPWRTLLMKRSHFYKLFTIMANHADLSFQNGCIIWKEKGNNLVEYEQQIRRI